MHVPGTHTPRQRIRGSSTYASCVRFLEQKPGICFRVEGGFPPLGDAGENRAGGRKVAGLNGNLSPPPQSRRPRIRLAWLQVVYDVHDRTLIGLLNVLVITTSMR